MTDEIGSKQVSPEGEEQDEDEEPAQPVQPFSYYLSAEVTFKILDTRWLLFSAICFVVYAYHFVWAMAGVDKFGHYTRLETCGAAKTPDEAQAVYDVAIALVTIFHIAEWARQTVFVITTLIGTNMVKVYYIMSFNVVYGVVALIVGIVAGFTSDEACQEVQSERAWYLKLQIISLILYCPFSFAHIIFFKLMGTEWLHQQWLHDPDEDEDEDDDGCCGCCGGDDKKED